MWKRVNVIHSFVRMYRMAEYLADKRASPEQSEYVLNGMLTAFNIFERKNESKLNLKIKKDVLGGGGRVQVRKWNNLLLSSLVFGWNEIIYPALSFPFLLYSQISIISASLKSYHCHILFVNDKITEILKIFKGENVEKSKFKQIIALNSELLE